MEHMEAEKSEQRVNRIDSLDSAQSSSMADTSSRPNSLDPDYEDALPVENVESPDSSPADVPATPTTTPELNQEVSVTPNRTDKSDNRDLDEYRRKLERRDASLDGSDLYETESTETNGSSYTTSESGTITGDEEPPYETIRTLG
jgi:hypothetical protein